ncbi:hypothetical protein AQUCO_07100010v1 [Aquilegia coerulea]|uniref:SUEL-type lectin domain-containing protein n=1 Tax=Aquilegia coerulea TaxID=218851 RepID=A0A2G5CAQ0_AQUCA|nr:hypothetical protein AQUCO_07100010v1 [Aquilegia coerulea]
MSNRQRTYRHSRYKCIIIKVVNNAADGSVCNQGTVKEKKSFVFCMYAGGGTRHSTRDYNLCRYSVSCK